MESSQLSTDAGSLNREEYPGIEERVSGEKQEKNKAECSLYMVQEDSRPGRKPEICLGGVW